MNPDGEDWRRGYDDWKASAPDTGSDRQSARSCCICKSNLVAPLFGCPNGHTPRERDAAAKVERGW